MCPRGRLRRRPVAPEPATRILCWVKLERLTKQRRGALGAAPPPSSGRRGRPSRSSAFHGHGAPRSSCGSCGRSRSVGDTSGKHECSLPPRAGVSMTGSALSQGTTNSTLASGPGDDRIARDAALPDPRRGSRSLGPGQMSRLGGPLPGSAWAAVGQQPRISMLRSRRISRRCELNPADLQALLQWSQPGSNR